MNAGTGSSLSYEFSYELNKWIVPAWGGGKLTKRRPYAQQSAPRALSSL